MEATAAGRGVVLKKLCTGDAAAKAQTDRVLTAKFELYWELATRDSRIIGIKPYHYWMNEPGVPANRSNSQFINQFALGATSYPTSWPRCAPKGKRSR